jgi:uncharacterized protein involved in high-affinity Fe2+ transport
MLNKMGRRNNKHNTEGFGGSGLAYLKVTITASTGDTEENQKHTSMMSASNLI